MINLSQRPLPDNPQHSQQTNIHAPGGIRTHDPAGECPKTYALDRAATGTGTASTINSQCYKISVLYVPQIFRTTVAGKYNLCCGLHIRVFCGLAVCPGLKPHYLYVTIRLNVSEASQAALAPVATCVFVGAFAHLRKVTASFVTSVCLSVWLAARKSDI